MLAHKEKMSVTENYMKMTLVFCITSKVGERSTEDFNISDPAGHPNSACKRSRDLLVWTVQVQAASCSRHNSAKLNARERASTENKMQKTALRCNPVMFHFTTFHLDSTSCTTTHLPLLVFFLRFTTESTILICHDLQTWCNVHNFE